MSKLLVIGGSHSDIPLIESALLRGLQVYTTGNRADHPGHWWSHKYVPADFSDVEAMLDVARSIGVDYVVPGANDFAMMSAAYVAEQLKLPGYDCFANTLLLHRKDQFKELATALGLPVCRHIVVNSQDIADARSRVDSLSFPLMIKPVDLTGGKGISKISSVEQLQLAMDKATAMTHQDKLVIEEWFDGELHSFSMVIENGDVVFDYCDTELCLFKDYLVSTSMSIGSISANAAQAVRNATTRLARQLGLVDGVLHSQILVRGDNVRILEYTRRMSGDLYSKVVQMVRGIRHADVFIDAAMGRSVQVGLVSVLPCHSFVVRHCVTAEADGVFYGVDVAEEVRPYVQSLTLAIPFGTTVVGDGSSKVATVILSFPREEEMKRFVARCKTTVKCKVRL